MNIVNILPTKTAEIHKHNNLYAVKLFNHYQYTETFYCRLKRDIEPQLNKLGYILNFDFTLLKN